MEVEVATCLSSYSQCLMQPWLGWVSVDGQFLWLEAFLCHMQCQVPPCGSSGLSSWQDAEARFMWPSTQVS